MPPSSGFPVRSVLPGQFLLKDIVLIGAALWTLGDSRRHGCAGRGRPSLGHSANRRRGSPVHGGRASSPRPRRVSHKSAGDRGRQPADPTGPELPFCINAANGIEDARSAPNGGSGVPVGSSCATAGRSQCGRVLTGEGAWSR